MAVPSPPPDIDAIREECLGFLQTVNDHLRELGELVNDSTLPHNSDDIIPTDLKWHQNLSKKLENIFTNAGKSEQLLTEAQKARDTFHKKQQEATSAHANTISILGALKDAAQSLQSDGSSLAATVASLREELKSATKAKEDLQNDFDARVKEATEKLADEIKELIGQVKKLQDERDNRIAEAKQQARVEYESEHRQAKIDAVAKAKDEELQRIKAEFASHLESISKLSDDFSKAPIIISDFTTHTQALTDTRESFATAIEDFKENAATATRSLIEAQSSRYTETKIAEAKMGSMADQFGRVNDQTEQYLVKEKSLEEKIKSLDIQLTAHGDNVNTIKGHIVGREGERSLRSLIGQGVTEEEDILDMLGLIKAAVGSGKGSISNKMSAIVDQVGRSDQSLHDRLTLMSTAHPQAIPITDIANKVVQTFRDGDILNELAQAFFRLQVDQINLPPSRPQTGFATPQLGPRPSQAQIAGTIDDVESEDAQARCLQKGKHPLSPTRTGAGSDAPPPRQRPFDNTADGSVNYDQDIAIINQLIELEEAWIDLKGVMADTPKVVDDTGRKDLEDAELKADGVVKTLTEMNLGISADAISMLRAKTTMKSIDGSGLTDDEFYDRYKVLLQQIFDECQQGSTSIDAAIGAYDTWYGPSQQITSSRMDALQSMQQIKSGKEPDLKKSLEIINVHIQISVKKEAMLLEYEELNNYMGAKGSEAQEELTAELRALKKRLLAAIARQTDDQGGTPGDSNGDSDQDQPGPPKAPKASSQSGEGGSTRHAVRKFSSRLAGAPKELINVMKSRRGEPAAPQLTVDTASPHSSQDQNQTQDQSRDQSQTQDQTQDQTQVDDTAQPQPSGFTVTSQPLPQPTYSQMTLTQRQKKPGLTGLTQRGSIRVKQGYRADTTASASRKVSSASVASFVPDSGSTVARAFRKGARALGMGSSQSDDGDDQSGDLGEASSSRVETPAMQPASSIYQEPKTIKFLYHRKEYRDWADNLTVTDVYNMFSFSSSLGWDQVKITKFQTELSNASGYKDFVTRIDRAAAEGTDRCTIAFVKAQKGIVKSPGTKNSCEWYQPPKARRARGIDHLCFIIKLVVGVQDPCASGPVPAFDRSAQVDPNGKRWIVTVENV